MPSKLASTESKPKDKIIRLTCDMCGEERETVSFHLSAKSDENNRMRGIEPGGYYPTYSVRLCRSCLSDILSYYDGMDYG